MENKVEEKIEKDSLDSKEEILEDLTEDGGELEETAEEAEKKEDEEFEELNDEGTDLEEENSKLLEENNKLIEDNKMINNKLNAAQDKFMRLSAEYDNYRKRTAKEKEGIYTDSCVDVLKEILPVIDNLERALAADGSNGDLKKGVEMTLKQFNDALEKLNVEEIPADGNFDPNLHNAVMHIESDEFGENEIAEVFQKGYKRGDKVLRYSMVKVAN